MNEKGHSVSESFSVSSESVNALGEQFSEGEVEGVNLPDGVNIVDVRESDSPRVISGLAFHPLAVFTLGAITYDLRPTFLGTGAVRVSHASPSVNA